MKNCFIIFLVITFLFNVILNNIGVFDFSLLVLASLLHISLISKLPFFEHMCKHVVIWLFYMSIIFLPSFHLVYHILDRKDMAQIDYDRLSSFGIKIYFIVMTSVVILYNVLGKKNTKLINFRYCPRVIPEKFVDVFFVFLFCLTFFCYSIGLGKMGSEQVELPFHLSGIINLFRRGLAPMLFVILIENRILNGKKIPNKYWILWGGWTIMEIFAWLSKSLIIDNFLNVIIVLMFYLRPSLKTISRKIIPLILVFLFLYPIIGVMRHLDEGSVYDNLKEARSVSEEESESNSINPLLFPLNRAFMTAQLYAQDYSYIDNSSLFDFSRTFQMIAMGGPSIYQTFVIDEYPEDAHHSSGTSGLLDPLLHGGYGLCYIMVVFIMFLTILVDNFLKSNKISIYVSWVLFMYGFSMFRNISMFYDSTGMQGFVVFLLGLFVANRVNFQNRYYVEGNEK